MKTKILLGLCLLLSIFAYACISDQCQKCGLPPNSQIVISYENNAGQVPRTSDGTGCVYYPPKNNSCAAVATPIGGGFSFFASPASVDLQAPPTDFSISGSGISATYGMPKIQYWDDNGTMLGEATATYVASDGSWLEAITPDLSSAYSGNWNIHVFNRNSDGSLAHIGTAPVEAYGRNYCSPSQGEIDSCEAGVCNSCFFDYDSCQCRSGY